MHFGNRHVRIWVTSPLRNIFYIFESAKQVTTKGRDQPTVLSAMKAMNHNNDQFGKETWMVQWWHAYVGGNQLLSNRLKTCSTGGKWWAVLETYPAPQSTIIVLKGEPIYIHTMAKLWIIHHIINLIHLLSFSSLLDFCCCCCSQFSHLAYKRWTKWFQKLRGSLMKTVFSYKYNCPDEFWNDKEWKQNSFIKWCKQHVV